MNRLAKSRASSQRVKLSETAACGRPERSEGSWRGLVPSLRSERLETSAPSTAFALLTVLTMTERRLVGRALSQPRAMLLIHLRDTTLAVLPLRLPFLIEGGNSFQSVLATNQDVVSGDIEGIGSSRVAVLTA